MVKKLHQQEHNIECQNWKELEEFKPSVEKAIESMKLPREGNGKAKGKGGWGAEHARKF